MTTPLTKEDQVREYYITQYREMHVHPKRFLGYSLKFHIEEIGKLLLQTGATTILDYGCGKGLQYLSRRWHEQWPGKVLPHCYDPAVLGLDAKPEGTFDAVLCVDVLEHIPETVVQDAVAELFKYANKFVYACVSCSPAHKNLPDGTNCHVTVNPPQWWRTLFAQEAGDKMFVLVFREDFGNGD